MDDSKRKKKPHIDLLKPVQISPETSRRIPAAGDGSHSSGNVIEKADNNEAAKEPKSFTTKQAKRNRHSGLDETDERSGTIYGRKGKKRIELASLLWGEKEDYYQTDASEALEEVKDPVPLTERYEPPQGTPISQDPPKEVVEEEKSKKKFEREVKRRECSFPGILTMLIPTQTFQPMKIAVRVVDVSPKGARVETRQVDFETANILNQDRWFSRLEMLVPHRDKVRIKGRVVWADFEEGMDTTLGVQFETICDEIEDIFSDTLSSESHLDDYILGSPVLDPFPSVTPSSHVTFMGRCDGCEEIVVSHGNYTTETKPINGRFEISVKLSENRTNFLSFTAIRGKVRSIPTPVAVLHKIGASETNSVSSDSLVEEFLISDSGDRLQMVLHGKPARFFQALKKIEQSLQYADEVTISLDLSGQAKKAAHKLEELMSNKKKQDFQ